MKKAISILAALILIVSFAVSANAAEQGLTQDTEDMKENIMLRVNEYMFSDAARAKVLMDEDHYDVSSHVDDIVRQEHLKAGWTETETMPHTAQEVLEIVEKEVDAQAVSLAYMDIEQAPEELKDYILSARREMIYRFEWLADGSETGIAYGSQDNEEEKTFEISPRFSDLFPGWYEPRLDLVLPDWQDAPDAVSDKLSPYEEVISAPVGQVLSIIYATPVSTTLMTEQTDR